MFKPEIIENNETSVKMRINEAIIITVDNDKFDADGTIDIDYDEKLLTAQEAEQLTNNFMRELISVVEQKGEN